LLSSLLNEPIPGQGVFWSSVGGKPYPLSIRALLFESMFPVRDPKHDKPAGNTYRKTLVDTFTSMKRATAERRVPDADPNARFSAEAEEYEPVDEKANIEQKAIAAFREDVDLMNRIDSDTGVAWGTIKAFFVKNLPSYVDEQSAFELVSKALKLVVGKQDEHWETYKRGSFQNPDKQVTYVRKKNPTDDAGGR